MTFSRCRKARPWANQPPSRKRLGIWGQREPHGSREPARGWSASAQTEGRVRSGFKSNNMLERLGGTGASQRDGTQLSDLAARDRLELNKCRSPAQPGPRSSLGGSPLSPLPWDGPAKPRPHSPALPPGSPRCLLRLGPSRVPKGDGHTINPLSYEGDTPYRVLMGDAPGGARATHTHPRDRPGPGTELTTAPGGLQVQQGPPPRGPAMGQFSILAGTCPPARPTPPGSQPVL